MKKFASLLFLLLFFSGALATVAMAQARPKINAKRAFAHDAGVGTGKTNKAHFRRENNIRPVIDLNPKKAGKAKTVKAPKPYKFGKAR